MLLNLQDSLYQSEISNAARILRTIDNINASPEGDHSAEYASLRVTPAEADYAISADDEALASPTVNRQPKFTVTAVLKRAVVALVAAVFCAIMLVYFVELLGYLKKRWQESK